eukprot:TRINITY_DN4165_c0_g1_i1.p2 TRINITY_DN4165_c0_g1~~TRINITY_DN4165_c0_g1_i1.p2  ORF type:complete len:132 (+),score=7.54 TRINITY_DN4165_c0_g1_i1:439-834(+)
MCDVYNIRVCVTVVVGVLSCFFRGANRCTNLGRQAPAADVAPLPWSVLPLLLLTMVPAGVHRRRATILACAVWALLVAVAVIVFAALDTSRRSVVVVAAEAAGHAAVIMAGIALSSGSARCSSFPSRSVRD